MRLLSSDGQFTLRAVTGLHRGSWPDQAQWHRRLHPVGPISGRSARQAACGSPPDSATEAGEIRSGAPRNAW